MGIKKLSGAEKAAIILLTLGEDRAAAVMAGMSRTEVGRVASALSRLGRVDATLAEAVLQEFQAQLTAPRPLTGDSAAARRLLHTALARAGSTASLDGVLDFATPALTATLAAAEPRAMARFLIQEHPQTTALILAHMPANKGAATLKLLPEDLRLAALVRLSRLGPVDPEVLMEVEASVRESLRREAYSSPESRIGGPDKVAALLGQLTPTASEALLISIGERHPELAEQVRALLFTFTDLVKIDDRGIQELLKAVTPETLRLALKAAPENIATLIYRNMSERAAALLRSDLETMKKIRLSDAQTAQTQIAQTARRLAAEGRIVVRSQDDLYV